MKTDEGIVFGMPALIELETLEETVSLCRALGLGFIELNMNLPLYQPGALSVEQLLHFEDVEFTLHVDENLNVWDFNPLVSKAYLDTLLFAIELCQKARLPIINMHMNRGVYFTLPGEKVFLFERYADAYLQKTLRLRQQCEAAIGGADIHICIENCSGYTAYEQKAIDCLLQSRVFGLTLDVGHHHKSGRRDETFIMERMDRLLHMHLHDATDAQDHLALGDGEVEMTGMLNLAKRLGCRCVLETKTVAGLKASVEHIKRWQGGQTST